MQLEIPRHFGLSGTEPIGVAVSGGGDSMALLVAMVDTWDGPIRVATVDHGLRPAAKDEAALVAEFCASHGVAHTTVTLTGLTGDANVMARARAARYDALGQWASDHGLAAVMLGHTLDDVAETFLMRLSRGAGVYGLSAMPDQMDRDGVRYLRPLLGCGRAALRDFLTQRDVHWVEDPTNSDDNFLRSRVRAALPMLAELGIDCDALTQTAGRLSQARDVVAHQVRGLLQQAQISLGGDVHMPYDTLALAQTAVRHHALSDILQWIGQSGYPPRAEKTGALFPVTTDRTLNGVLILRQGAHMVFAREYNAVAAHHVPTSQIWDGRWTVETAQEGMIVRALGPDGWQHAADRKTDIAPKHKIAIGHPSLWRGDHLIAAPSLGIGPADTFILDHGPMVGN